MKKMLNSKRLITLSLIISLCFSIFFALNLSLKFTFNSSTQIDNKSMITQPSISSVYSYEWNKTWGASEDDDGSGIALDSSENIYIIGSTENYGAGDYDICLVKFNSLGVQQWYRTWGGIFEDMGLGIAIDSNDNVYVTGYTKSFGAGNEDIVLIKYDSAGVQQWNRTWGKANRDKGFAIAFDSNNNTYVTGYIFGYGEGYTDIVLIKYDSAGVQQWNSTYGGSSYDEGHAIVIDSSDNIFVTGYEYRTGGYNDELCLVKYNSLGVQQWNQTWGGTDDDQGHGITLDSSNNIYITGETKSYGEGSADIVLVKFNSLGVQQWYRTWGGGSYDYGRGVAMNSSGDIYIVGETNSYGMGGYDMCLVKYNSSGLQQWNRTWGGGSEERGDGFAVDSSGNVYLTGFTASFGAGDFDMVLLKFGVDSDEDGFTDWVEENIYLTDPNDPDSDDDGLTDYEEINLIYHDYYSGAWVFGTDPNDPDSDDDGLTDGEEMNTYYTNPMDSDSDDDGYTDGEEVASGHNPRSSGSNPGVDNMVMLIILIIVLMVIIIITLILVRKSKKKRIKKKEVKKKKEEERQRKEEREKHEAMEREERERKERIELEEREQRDREAIELEPKLRERFPMIEQLIRDRNFSNASSELNDIINKAEPYDLDDVLNWARKRLSISDTFDRLTSLFKISERVKIEDLALTLEMERGDLFRKFGEWSQTFDFTIDGDYIKIKSEDMDAFMDALDKSFETWESPEKKTQKM